MEHYLSNREILLKEMIEETLSDLYDCNESLVPTLTTNLIQLRARLHEVEEADAAWSSYMWHEAHGHTFGETPCSK